MLFRTQDKRGSFIEVPTNQTKQCVSWMSLSHMLVHEPMAMVSKMQYTNYLTMSHLPLLPLELGWGGVVPRRKFRVLLPEWRKPAGRANANDPMATPFSLPIILSLYNTEFMRPPRATSFISLSNSCLSSPLESSPTSHTNKQLKR